jgi:hypothetical protein
LIPLHEKRKSLGLKTNSQKNIKKIKKMISELKINQASTFVIHQKKTNDFSDTDSISSHNSTSSNIKILEENFGKINLEQKIQRIFDKPKPVNFTKNWYSRPTPFDLQFEEKFLQSQFSVSSDKLYEWNIDGLSEQELVNKMNHMSMVANAYDTNQNLSESEIVDLLATGFSRTLRNWRANVSLKFPKKKLEKLSRKTKMAYPFFMKNLVEVNLIVLIL